MITLLCITCGKEFLCYFSDFRKFCSKTCFRNKRKKSLNTCPVCGKPSSRFSTFHCSAMCYHKSRIGKLCPARMRRFTKECLLCNKHFEVGGRLSHKDKKYCSKDCVVKARWKHIDNAFQGGRSGYWQELRKIILLKYDNKCGFCGHIKNLQVHHRTPRKYGGTHKEDNLMASCRHCHGSVDKVIRIAKDNNPNFDCELFTQMILGVKL